MKTILQNRRQFLGTVSVAGAAFLLPSLVGTSGGQVLAAESTFTGTKVNVPKWWLDQYRILQTNLREIDALQNPKAIARAVREFGATALVTNIGGIVAFYPTQLELQYTNPYLKGRDFAGEMIEAARAEGLTVLGRFDLSKTRVEAYAAHPDWFMKTRAGEPIISEGAYHACPNGDWAQKYSFEIMGEAVPRYICDGYFFNMTGYRTTNYQGTPHGICACENCQRRFKAMYGLELPKTDGFKNPIWTTYIEFQERTVNELSTKVRSFIDQFTDAPILSWNTYSLVGRGEIHRRLHHHDEWAYMSGDQARWAMARNPGLPFSSTSTAHIDYPWRQATETAACHLLRFAQQLGTGAQLDLYLMGTIDDQDDPSYLPPVSELFKWHEAHKGFYDGLKPSAKVALYSSYNNDRYGGVGGFTDRSDAYRGAYKALVDARIPFWMVNDLRIADGSTDLSAYDVIVMPDIKIVSDAEIAALDKFVENGGTLLVTGQTGVSDERGNRRDGIGFQSFPGSSYGEPVDARGWTGNLDTAEINIGQGRMVIDDTYYPMNPRRKSNSLMSRAPDQRYGPPEFTYAIPGDKPGDEPVVLERKYGKGRVIHIPWLPDALYYRHGLVNHRDLITTLVERHAPPRQYLLEGAGPVELMVMHQPSTGKDLIHVINYAGQRDGLYQLPPTISGMKLGVRKKNASALELIGDTTLSGTTRDGYTWFELPPIETFTAISLS